MDIYDEFGSYSFVDDVFALNKLTLAEIIYGGLFKKSEIRPGGSPVNSKIDFVKDSCWVANSGLFPGFRRRYISRYLIKSDLDWNCIMPISIITN